MKRFSLTLPSDSKYVIAARLLATSVAGIAGFNVEQIEDIRMAVGEAMNNAVIHSNCNDEVSLDVDVDDSFIQIRVSDHGKGFNPGEVQMDLNNYQGNGLGLFIIDSLMDEVNIDSKNKAGTSITMRKMK